MVTSREIADRLRTFITTTFPIGKERLFDDTTSLLESGVIDSLGVLELVGYLESEFGLTLHDDELVAENFDSVHSLTVFVIGALEKRGSHGLPGSPLASQ